MDDVDLPPPNTPEGQPPTWLPGPDEYNYNMLDPGPVHEPRGPTAPDLLWYNPKQGIWVKDYLVPTVGMPIRVATKEEMARYVIGDSDNIDIGALSDPQNFELAEFLIHSGLSVQEQEKFLNLAKFQGQMPWSSNYKLMQDIDKLPHKSEWKHEYYE
ncbi:hypothetical protein FRC11_012686, partial [Ceratobasidium sp. 423]